MLWVILRHRNQLKVYVELFLKKIRTLRQNILYPHCSSPGYPPFYGRQRNFCTSWTNDAMLQFFALNGHIYSKELRRAGTRVFFGVYIILFVSRVQSYGSEFSQLCFTGNIFISHPILKNSFSGHTIWLADVFPPSTLQICLLGVPGVNCFCGEVSRW